MSRLAVMAHYDPTGMVGPHVRRHVAALAAAVDDLVVVSTATLGDEERAFLEGHGRLVVRENIGYDFYSYKTGLDASPDLGDHDEVVLCNDTYVGPLRSYDDLFGTMAEQPVDFWGLSGSQRVSPHLQSFFVTFRSWVVAAPSFRRFWGDMSPVSDRSKVIKNYEVGLSGDLAGAGFRWAPYFQETDRDVRLAKRRVAWWAAHRRPMPRTRQQARFLAQTARVPWNPAIGLADAALDGGRLPYVKLDTLRYDPYGLGSDRLLRLCEQRFPDAFDGVRAYLDATRKHYPGRSTEQLRPTPGPLRPLRPLVEYGRAA